MNSMMTPDDNEVVDMDELSKTVVTEDATIENEEDDDDDDDDFDEDEDEESGIEDND